MKDIIFFTPYDKQIEVIEALEDPEITTVVCIAGRQSGKTILAQNIACKWCLDEKDLTVMWVAPTDNQALKVYKEIVKVFPKKTNVIKTKKGAKGDIEIIFFNGSQILFRSAGSTDTLRGNSINYLVVDEAAFVVEDTLTTIIMPTMNVRGRKKLLISTPKGKNYLHKWYLNGQSGEYEFRKWKSFRFNCFDSPFISVDVIEEAKATMTDVKFRQEYLAEFVDNASVFKNIDDVLTINATDKPIPGEKYYAGVDIGLGTDASVISIIDGYGNLVKYFKYEETQAQNVIDNIIELNKVWKFRRILFETNNNGLPMYQTLKKTLTNIEDFSTSAKTKPQIINRLIYLFDTRTIRCLNDNDLRIELEAFNFKQNENGNVKYGAASGFHDDIVMSFAIARECYERSRFNGKYVGFF
jgi:terminase large subunit-like protein